ERLGLAEEGVHVSRDLRRPLAQPHRLRQQPSRSLRVSPGRNPLSNRLSSAPVTKTTSAPRLRRRSARSAQSASKSSSLSVVRSLVNGENQTSRPTSAASEAAISSRSG